MKLRKMVIGIMITVVVIILGFYIGIGYIANKVFNGEKPATEQAGEAARKIKDSFNKGFYGDSTEVDSVKIID